MNQSAMGESFLSRQPVLNHQDDLVGYELTLMGEPANPSSAQASAAMLVCAAYTELGIRSALGRNTAFLRVDSQFLHDDAIETLPADAVVLELAIDSVPDKRTIDRCRFLRERRYSLALADYTGLDDRSRPLLTMLDVVKINTREHGHCTLNDLAAPLTRLPLKLLAQGVESREEADRCLKMGFRLFQGHYFARPEIVSGRRLSASQNALIRLINLASRDADTATIENGIKHEPALAVNLLGIVNSVGYGLPQRVNSLRHAITVLGRRQLQRWLQLLLMTPAGKPPDASRPPLLQIAALRGRMMETLIEQICPNDRKLADQAFITGIMSMMPAALGMPLNEIFEHIALEPEIIQALSSQDDLLGKTLGLLECFDGEDVQGCDRRLGGFSAFGLDRGSLNDALSEALRWINGDDAAN